MRISTSLMFQRNTNSILSSQAATQKSAEEVSSGKRVNNTSDDPIAAIGIENLNQQNAVTDQYLKNIDYSTNKLESTESILGNAQDIAIQLKEQMLSLSNGSYSEKELETIATDMRANLEALESLANSRDESGNYIFGGFDTNQQPFNFVGVPRTMQYSGDDGVRTSVVADGVTVNTNIPGSDIFMNAENALGDYAANYSSPQTGNFSITAANVVNESANPAANYTLSFVDDGSGGTNVEINDGTTTVTQAFSNPLTFDGVELEFDGEPAIGDSVEISQQSSVSIFDTVEQAIALAESGNVQTPAGQSELAQLLDNTDQGINQIGQMRSEAGTSLKNVENYQARHEEAKLVNDSAKSKLEDLDIAEAVTELQKNQLALQVTSSVFSKVNTTTLFDYL